MIDTKKLDKTLDFLGYSEANKGTGYIRSAVAAADAQRDGYKLGAIYAGIARKARTTPQAVERAMRTATEAAFDAAGWEPGVEIFGNCIGDRCKATNREVVARLARLCRED